MERENVPREDRQVLWQRLILIEEVGPEALPGCIVPLEDEFYTMNIKARPGHMTMNPILCYGPFADREVTLLVGSPTENGILGPVDLLPVARHNLATLKLNWRRRVLLHESRTARTS